VRYINIPNDVTLEGAADRPPLSFASFIRKGLVADARVTENDGNVTKFMEIEEAVRDIPVGAVLPLTDEVWEFLSLLVRTFNYDPNLKLSLLPFVKAVTSASTKLPDPIV
jgi:hypothetical protein